MPTYEYECLSCGHHFEMFQMMTDEPIKICPKCKQPVRRLIGTGSGIIFKGAGFYATDYRKPNPQAATCQQNNTFQNKNSQDKTPQNKKPEEKKSCEGQVSGDGDSKSR